MTERIKKELFTIENICNVLGEPVYISPISTVAVAANSTNTEKYSQDTPNYVSDSDRLPAASLSSATTAEYFQKVTISS